MTSNYLTDFIFCSTLKNLIVVPSYTQNTYIKMNMPLNIVFVSFQNWLHIYLGKG